MTNATQMPLSGIDHLNHGLFSDYYLEHIAPTLEEWKSDSLYKRAADLRDELRVLLDNVHPETLDEAQLEEQWVKPVLERLGSHWSVQVKIRYRETGYRKPDYVFTATAAEANALTNQIYEPAEIAHALAVGDAKRWGVSLDQASGPDGRNPSQQIDEYLRYSELDWGILTDGRIWRLYERDSSKSNSYYAVDLPHLLHQETARPFLYFYLFFRQEAFTSHWLENVLKASEDQAQALSDKLEDQVYLSLELIAQGFLNYRRNRLQPDAATLTTIYEQSLVLLYRLLFIFYAESREILPLNHNEAYTATKSLTAIKKAVEQRLKFPAGLDADNTRFYTWLNDLFFIIDSGSDAHDVPPYNGRLFSEPDHLFLTEKAVGDAFLVPALDSLARVDEAQNRGRTAPKRVYVDYRDLDVRHLGAIYEKLLEYQLDIAAEPLVLKDGKYVAAAADETPVKQPGEVYLRTGSNERKITGSYYTPDYIVRYIVEQTLEPLLTDLTGQYADLDEAGHWQVRDRAALRQAILGLNVIDPATGSGHFMVEATAYIAEWLRRLGLQPDDLAEGEDELVYWKRQVVTACIYGVDVNPLAVELAKLSLWLTTLGRGKPLSFLDHHVQAGNSLVGVRVDEIEAPTEIPLRQEAAFIANISDAVTKMTTIEGTITTNVKQVKQQEQTYARLADELTNWLTLAHVWTARQFGLALDAAGWQAVYDQLVNGQPSDAARAVIEQAEKLAADHHFFHWELAFPEVFFAADGQARATPGFDAVIGNPPYVRQEHIQPIKRFLQTRYKVYSGTADLFLYFYEQGLELLHPERRLGYITSGTYMNSASAKPFRSYIHENAAFESVANFGENQPFPGAEMVYPTIAVMRHGKPRETFRNLFVEGIVRNSDLADALENGEWTDSLSEVTGMDEWRFQPKALTELFKKIVQNRPTLSDVVGGRIYRGITTGLNEAFVIDDQTRRAIVSENPNCAEIIKPLSEGKDFRPWYQIDSGLYLILAYQGINIETYQAVKMHLSKWERELAKRWEAEKGQIKWYELRPCEYYAEFEQPKIYWAEISKLPRFSRDDFRTFFYK